MLWPDRVYWAAIFFVTLACLVAGVFDVGFWLEGSPTISAYLREHPLAFWVPALAAAAFLGWMTYHLFG